MRTGKTFIVFVLLLLVSAGNLWARTPIGMLTEPQGKVEYSKDGKRWKKVRRNVFMYDSYQVRTNPDSSVTFINQTTNQTTSIPAGTVAQVSAEGIQAVSGELGNQQAAGDLVAGLGDKFIKTQKYTTVRRSAKKPGIQLKAGNVVITGDFPDLVWENVGPQYSYRVRIGEKNRKTREWEDLNTYEIPATDAPLIRATIEPPADNVRYFVEVLDGTEVVYTTRESRLKGLTSKRLNELKQQSEQAQSMDSSGFLYANLLTDYGILVGAMDVYEQFFQEYADDEDVNDLRPFLIEIYSRLYLEEMKSSAIKAYNDQL